MYFTNDMMKVETTNNLWFQPICFDENKFQINDMQVMKRNTYDPLSVIRWRNSSEKQSSSTAAQTSSPKTESNCRLLKWQDGT